MSTHTVERKSVGAPADVKLASSGWIRSLRVPAVVGMFVMLSNGCMYGSGEQPTGSSVQELNTNEHTAFDYFLSKGLTAIQAAGIVGNLIQESNCDPTAVQAGGPGRGIAQWSAGGRWDTDSGDNAVWYAGTQGASVWSLNLQLDFIWYELTHISYYGLSELRSATDVSTATIDFETRFEGCGQCEQSTRISYANQVLAAWGSDASAAWGGQFVSQSFPYASVGSVSIPAGGSTSVSLTMKNIGTHAWDSHTCIGTTMPRDRVSVFAGAGWPSSNRPACVPSGTTVAPGANHTFTWTMHAPSTTGRYDEHWGMVEDGVAWFSDSGEGGPPDNQLEGIFVVTAPPPPPPPPPDAGVPDAGVHDAGAGDAGTHDASVGDASMADASHDAAREGGAGTDGGSVRDAAADATGVHDAGDAGGLGDAFGARDGADGGGTGEMSAGCSVGNVGGTRSARSELGMLVFAAIAVAGARRRRRMS